MAFKRVIIRRVGPLFWLLDIMIKQIALLTLLLLAPFSFSAQSMSNAPEGFSWYAFNEGNTAFLKPDGWFVKKEVKNGVTALFITKQKIKQKTKFSTGLTFNYLRNVKASTGTSASVYAKEFLAKAARDNSELKSYTSTLPPGYTGLGLRVKKEGGTPVVINYYLLANDNADTLRLIFFEAPESEWDASWITGERMLKFIMSQQ